MIFNSTVRRLVFYFERDMHVAILNALQRLVESTTSIQHLELYGAMQFGENRFRGLSQGLINSRNVTSITVDSVLFPDGESMNFLIEILEGKQNLRSLSLRHNGYFYSGWRRLHGALCSALRRPDSPLRRFELFQRVRRDEEDRERLRALCEAVANSKLDFFSFGNYDDPRDFGVLVNAIPSMKIHELVIHFGNVLEGDAHIDTLHPAVKRNFTLQSVKYAYHAGDPFDASEDDATLKFYIDRNIRLAEWLENPNTVPNHLWKEAVTLATKAGPNMLFQTLQKTGHEVLPAGRRNKRKRIG